jgi:hypothetical protein
MASTPTINALTLEARAMAEENLPLVPKQSRQQRNAAIDREATRIMIALSEQSGAARTIAALQDFEAQRRAERATDAGVTRTELALDRRAEDAQRRVDAANRRRRAVTADTIAAIDAR